MNELTLRPPATRAPLLLQGAATGAATMLAGTFVYQLLRASWHVAATFTSHGGAPPAPDSAARVVGVYVLGGLLSLGPATLVGGIVGALLGGILTATWRRQGPVRAWLTGTLLAWMVALVVNTSALSRHRRAPFSYERWSHLLGYPSVVFVLAFGVIGAWLHRQAREPARPQVTDLI